MVHALDQHEIGDVRRMLDEYPQTILLGKDDLTLTIVRCNGSVVGTITIDGKTLTALRQGAE